MDEHDFYKAEAMATYLRKYVQVHEYAGFTMNDRIHFGAEVISVEACLEGWRIFYTSNGNATNITSHKLIVATGSTSVPNMPDLPNQQDFGGPIIHTLDYGRSKFYESDDIKSVAVIGGGKSAADMVYMNVKLGRSVKWIIRSSGKGPGAFLNVKLRFASIRNAGDLAYVRFAASILTLPGLQPASYWQRFLYSTRIGSWVFNKFNVFLNNQLVVNARYDDRPGAMETFKELKSNIDAMALESPTGIQHHDDFWDVIAKNVDVYRKDIAHLKKGKIVFTDNVSIEADAILCGTGFKDTVPFFTEKQRVHFGLPHAISAEAVEMQREWKRLNIEAERKVTRRFYSITSRPAIPPVDRLGDVSLTETPFRLYSGIAPLTASGAHNLAFVGFATLTNMFASSEVSAIWATAYLDGNIKLPNEEQMKQDIAYVTTYMRMRCPTYGRAGNYYIFDYHQFIDRLMDQVGLQNYSKGLWRDWTEPLVMADFQALKDEYVEKHGSVRD